MSSRREFLRLAGAAIAAGSLPELAGCGAGGNHDSPEAPPPPSASAFTGQAAGEGRVVGGVALRWCPSGRFTMGSLPTEPGHRPDESQVEVTLSRGFWMAQHEATQGEWSAVMGAWPDRPPTDRFGAGSDVPMYWVSYDAAAEFCARLTLRAHASGDLPSDWIFTLPTEAQWEYACRAGTTGATAFGDTLRTDLANFALDPPTRPNVANYPGRARPVGSYPANPWGIHDMHGNVWEWCRDRFHRQLPGGIDPDLSNVLGMQNRDGSYSRVRRGGAWIEGADFCRSAARLPYEPHRVSDHIGFRVVVVQA